MFLTVDLKSRYCLMGSSGKIILKENQMEISKQIEQSANFQGSHYCQLLLSVLSIPYGIEISKST